MEKFYCLYHWTFTKKKAIEQVHSYQKYFASTPSKSDLSGELDFNENYLIGDNIQELSQKQEPDLNVILEKCQSQGYNDNSDVNNNYTLLKWAVITHKSIQVIIKLTEQFLPTTTWLQNDSVSGDSLLHIATKHEHLDAMEYFLSLGVKVNSKNSRGDTPLHLALLCSADKFTPVTKILVKNGADLNCVDECGNSFAHLCASHLNREQYVASVNCLIELGYSYLFRHKNDLNQTPVHIAVLTGLDVDWETLKLIATSSGYDFNERYSEGDTLLHYAARWAKRENMLEHITELGGDHQLRNHYQKTVLHCAVAGSNVQAISYFISLGGDLNSRDFLGRTPLHHLQFAKQEKIVEVTKLLVEAGADLYAVDDCGNTVAHHLSSKFTDIFYSQWSHFIAAIGHDKLFNMMNNSERAKCLQ